MQRWLLQNCFCNISWGHWGHATAFKIQITKVGKALQGLPNPTPTHPTMLAGHVPQRHGSPSPWCWNTSRNSTSSPFQCLTLSPKLQAKEYGTMVICKTASKLLKSTENAAPESASSPRINPHTIVTQCSYNLPSDVVRCASFRATYITFEESCTLNCQET